MCQFIDEFSCEIRSIMATIIIIDVAKSRTREIHNHLEALLWPKIQHEQMKEGEAETTFWIRSDILGEDFI